MNCTFEMMTAKLNNRKELKAARRDERNNAPPAEAALWSSLKGRQVLGLKFRRQHSIGPFMLDFYCPSVRLAIELDGQYHMNPTASANDSDRDAFIAELGMQVIRFENKHVFTDHEDVLLTIEETAKERMQALGRE